MVITRINTSEANKDKLFYNRACFAGTSISFKEGTFDILLDHSVYAVAKRASGYYSSSTKSIPVPLRNMDLITDLLNNLALWFPTVDASLMVEDTYIDSDYGDFISKDVLYEDFFSIRVSYGAHSLLHDFTHALNHVRLITHEFSEKVDVDKYSTYADYLSDALIRFDNHTPFSGYGMGAATSNGIMSLGSCFYNFCNDMYTSRNWIHETSVPRITKPYEHVGSISCGFLFNRFSIWVKETNATIAAFV